MTLDLSKIVTEEETSLVHRCLLDAFATVRFPGDHEEVTPGLRFLAAQPKLKNEDSPFSDKDLAPRYPSITVFCFQPSEQVQRRVGEVHDVFEDPDNPGHSLVAIHDYPSDFLFRYQVHLASDRQDHHDLMYMKVMKLFRRGADRALVVKGGAYEVMVENLTTRVVAEEGVQTTDIEFRVKVPVLFLRDPEDETRVLPAIEEVILQLGVPDKLQDLDEVEDFEEVQFLE